MRVPSFWRLLQVTYLICPFLLASFAEAQDALVTPKEGEVLVGPVVAKQNLGQIEVFTRVSGFLAISTADEGITVSLRTIADLGDLQRKIGPIVDTLPFPTDNCGRFSGDNLVVRVWGKKLVPMEEGAFLELRGDIEIWACVRNPVPCSRIDWEVRDVGLGVKTKVPVVSTWDCNPPIKNRTLRQPFTASLDLKLMVPDPYSISLVALNPNVDLGGALGGVTEGLLKIAGVDLTVHLQKHLDKVVSEVAFRPAIPDEVARFNPVVKNARLFNNAGTLSVSVELEAFASGTSLTQLVQLLANEQQKQ